MKEGGYPVDRTDGELVYDGADSSCSHTGLDPETTYYYSAWSYVSGAEETLVWSGSATQTTGTTQPAPDEVTMSIPLAAGWNMVSVPLLLVEQSPDDVFPDAEAIYTWNAEAKSYRIPTSITPYSGYWVAVANPDGLVVEVTGVPMSAWEAPVHQGWNQLGSVYSDSAVSVDQLSTDVAPDPIQRNAIYHWDPVSRSYQSVNEFAAGKGYWVASTADCTAYLSSP